MDSSDQAPEGVGDSTTASGEDIAKQEKEPGREDLGPTGESERPAGRSSGRDSSGVDPQNPIDPESPNLQTP